MIWTPEKIGMAAKMRQSGRGYGEIGAHFGVSRASVLGMAKRNRALFPFESEAARAVRLSARKAPAKVSAQPRFTWDDDRRKLAAALCRQGQSVRAISRTIGCSPSTVTKMMKANPALFPALKKPVERSVAKQDATPGPKRDAKPGPTRCDLSQYRIPGVQPKTMLTVKDGECRFPLAAFGAADGPDVPVCGAPVQHGKSWCAAHCRVAFEGRTA